MKLFFKEDRDFLLPEDKHTLDEITLSGLFPFYLQKNTIGKDNKHFLSHIIVGRVEYRKENDNGINSKYADFFIKILNQFCDRNNIKYKNILRYSLNLAFYDGIEKSGTHVDHDVPHKQLIIYLNNPMDITSHTVLLNKKKDKVIKRIVPEKFKGVCFNQCPHYMVYPKRGHRIIAIATFN